MIELIERRGGGGNPGDRLTLTHDQRQRSRQRVHLDSGREAKVLLPHGTPLNPGDRLYSATGLAVEVCAAVEPVTTASARDPLLLARAAYHLGNRHVAVQIGIGWLRYQPDHVLDEMVRGLGLALLREDAPFEPERGAYHRHTHEHAHLREDKTDHGATPSNEPAIP